MHEGQLVDLMKRRRELRPTLSDKQKQGHDKRKIQIRELLDEITNGDIMLEEIIDDLCSTLKTRKNSKNHFHFLIYLSKYEGSFLAKVSTQFLLTYKNKFDPEKGFSLKRYFFGFIKAVARSHGLDSDQKD